MCWFHVSVRTFVRHCMDDSEWMFNANASTEITKI